MVGKDSAPPSRGFLSRLVLVLALLSVGLALLAITVFHTFPLGIAEESLKARLKGQGVLVSWQALDRTFPFGLRLQKVEVVDLSTGRLVVRIDEARARLDPLSLFKGYAGIPVWARLGRGVVKGDARVRFKGADLELEAAGMEPGAIPAVAHAGVSVDGSVDGTLALHMPWNGCPTGFVRLRSGRIRRYGVRFRGVPLPLGEVDEAGLNAQIRGCRAVIEGMWVYGKDLSAKLSGEVSLRTPLAASPLNMSIDITPKGDLMEKQWLLSFISPWRRSSNYYSMTVRGTVGHPVIVR
ncbi:MAG: type II secretion system protein GspN [Thermodesulfobacteriota bacterium]